MSASDATELAEEFLRTEDRSEAHIVFNTMAQDKRAELLPTAWKIAAQKPTPKVRQAASDRLAMIMAIEGHRQAVLPNVVKAIIVNKLDEAYPLLRNGFFHTGKEIYMDAMILLSPEAATEDILVFLSGVAGHLKKWGEKSGQELIRQTLGHLTEYPPSMINPNFTSLLNQVTSSDPKARSLVIEVIDGQMEIQPKTLAFLTSKADETVQQRLVEGLLKSENEKALQIYLQTLMDMTPTREVRSMIATYLR